MIDYTEFEENEDFMDVLEYLRFNCLASEWEVADGLDMDMDIVDEHFKLAQAIVSEEIMEGEVASYDADIALGFMDYLEDIDID